MDSVGATSATSAATASAVERETQAYLAQLAPREAHALRIARMLGTSFDLRKSNGFLEWKKRQPPNGL